MHQAWNNLLRIIFLENVLVPTTPILLPKTGEILEIYDPPTGKTDAIAMQHDVDYSVCGDDKKCKHVADRKMVKSLDAVPWNER